MALCSKHAAAGRSNIAEEAFAGACPSAWHVSVWTADACLAFSRFAEDCTSGALLSLCTGSVLFCDSCSYAATDYGGDMKHAPKRTTYCVGVGPGGAGLEAGAVLCEAFSDPRHKRVLQVSEALVTCIMSID